MRKNKLPSLFKIHFILLPSPPNQIWSYLSPLDRLHSQWSIWKPISSTFQHRKANSNLISSVTVHEKMTARRQVRCGQTKGAERTKRYRWWEQIETKWRAIRCEEMLGEMSCGPVVRIYGMKRIILDNDRFWEAILNILLMLFRQQEKNSNTPVESHLQWHLKIFQLMKSSFSVIIWKPLKFTRRDLCPQSPRLHNVLPAKPWGRRQRFQSETAPAAICAPYVIKPIRETLG